MTRKTKLWLPILMAVLMVVCLALAACTDPAPDKCDNPDCTCENCTGDDCECGDITPPPHECNDKCTTCDKCTSSCTDPVCSGNRCDYNGNHPADKCDNDDCDCDNCTGDGCTCGDQGGADAPLVSAPFYGAIGAFTANGSGTSSVSVLAFDEDGGIWASYGDYHEDSATYTISAEGAISIKVDNDEIGSGSIVGRKLNITITLSNDSNQTTPVVFSGDLYKANVTMDGDTYTWYIAEKTPLILLVGESDPDTTVKVNGVDIPFADLADTKMPAMDDISIEITSPTPTYTVSYSLGDHPASGTATPNGGTYDKNEGIKLAAAVPAAHGYSFAGWSDGNGNTYQPDDDYTVTDNVTFTAIWTANTYTVTYAKGDHAADDATLDPTSEPCLYNESVTLPAALAAADGWVFAGWSDGSDTYQPGDSYTVLDDVTLTATWAKIISIDDIAGVYTSDSGEAVISDVVPQGESYNASVIVGNRYAPLYANSDNTAFAYQDFTVKYYDEGKVTINDVVYTRTGDIVNADYAAFAGTWKLDDGNLVLTIENNSISYSGEQYFNPSHFFMGKYLVLFNSSAEHYTLYVNDGAISGMYKRNDDVTSVTFSAYVDETVYLSSLVGIWEYDGHTAYISTVKYNDKGDGSLILDGAFHYLTAGADNTWTYTYNSYKVYVTYVDANTVHIKAETPYDGTMEGDFTKSDKALENGVLSNYDGNWDIAWNSSKYTLKVDSATNTFSFSAGWTPITVYCIIGEYIVVSTGDPYFALRVESNGAADPTMTGKVTAGNGPEALVCDFVPPPSIACDWPEHVGSYIFDASEGRDGIGDDDNYAIIITVSNIILVINDDIYVADATYDSSSSRFYFSANGANWTFTVGRSYNLWDEDDVDIYFNKYDEEYSKLVGTYAGNITLYTTDDNESFDSNDDNSDVVITVTPIGIVVTVDGVKVDATIDSYDDSYEGIGYYDLYISIMGVNYCFEGEDEYHNGYYFTQVAMFTTDDDQCGDVEYIIPKADGACEWEEYIGVYFEIYDDSCYNSDYEGLNWVVTITRDGISLSIDGVPYDVANVEFDAEWQEFTFTVADFVEGTWTIVCGDDDDYIEMYTSGYAVDVYFWKPLDEPAKWEEFVGTYEGTYNNNSFKIIITRRSAYIYVDGEYDPVDDFGFSSGSFYLDTDDSNHYEVKASESSGGKVTKLEVIEWNSDYEREYGRTTLDRVGD